MADKKCGHDNRSYTRGSSNKNICVSLPCLDLKTVDLLIRSLTAEYSVIKRIAPTLTDREPVEASITEIMRIRDLLDVLTILRKKFDPS